MDMKPGGTLHLLGPGASWCSRGNGGVSSLPCPLSPSVCCPFQEASNRLSSHIPLVIQYFILQSYGQQLQKAMLQLLQDKQQYSWLLKERSDTSEKRRLLKERHARLTQARHQLAKFPG